MVQGAQQKIPQMPHWDLVHTSLVGIAEMSSAEEWEIISSEKKK
jgi:hypothetical protein